MVAVSPTTLIFNWYLLGSSPILSKKIMVCSQKPPPILCTPMILPRSSSNDFISFRTINSRGILLLGEATQTTFSPAEAALSTLEDAGQVTCTLPDDKVARIIGPLRTWSMLTSRPYFLNVPFSIPTHMGATFSL